MEHLKELVTNCRVCLKYSQANCKDSKSIGPPLAQEIPTRPWVKLATDIFTFNNQNYLPIVDYMSRFPVIRHLSNMTAKMVAEHMKAIFSELGIPKTLVSDNGPCYTGDQFKKTMSHLGITHITTKSTPSSVQWTCRSLCENHQKPTVKGQRNWSRLP